MVYTVVYYDEYCYGTKVLPYYCTSKYILKCLGYTWKYHIIRITAVARVAIM